MDIRKLLKSPGFQIKNPNKKSKKDKEPAYITVPFTRENSGNIYSEFNKEMGEQGKMFTQVDNPEKYNEYGITISRQNIDKLDKQLADSQSNWEKAWHALTQTVVSEIGLGTIRAAADLLDFTIGGLARAITGEENDYQNPVSEKIQEWQTAFEEAQPIYVDPDLNIANGGLTDAGWWFKNVPTIASSLTLLIPGTGAAKAVSLAGKAAGVGKVASKTRRWLTGVNKIKDAEELNALQLAINNPTNIARINKGVENFGTALVMRTMENYQESRDVYVPKYQEASNMLFGMSDEEYTAWINNNKDLVEEDVDINDRDAVAKNIAKQAADRTFAMDFSNLIFDFIQLYDLKNIGKSVKQLSKRGGGHAVQEAQRQALRGFAEQAGMTVDKTMKNGFFNKMKYIGTDFIKGTAKHTAIESTEGIEEAVNYIAQQEGLTYGTALLNGTAIKYDDHDTPSWLNTVTFGITDGVKDVINSWRYLQNPLNNYLSDPSLYENAFWGLMGGIAFGAGGSALNRASLAIQRKQNEKRRKEEGIDIKDERGNDFISLFELPTTTAARIGVMDNLRKFEVAVSNMKDIENGIDIFGKPDENGKKPQFTGTDAEIKQKQELARARVEADYFSDATISSLNSGTYNLFEALLESDEVRQAFVKQGFTTEEESKQYQQEKLKQAKEIRDLYSRQSTHVLNQLSAINASRQNKHDIPVEYAQIIAKNNVDRILEAKAIDKQIAVLNTLSEKDKIAILEPLTDEEKNKKEQEIAQQKEGIRLGVLATLYNMYEDEEKRIKESEEPVDENGKTMDSFAKAQQLRSIQHQKEYILQELAKSQFNIDGTNKNMSIGATVFTLASTGNFEKQDAELIKETRKLLNLSKEDVSDDVILNEGKIANQRMQEVLGNNGLKQYSKTLFDKYGDIATLELTKNTYLSTVATTQEQISDQVDFWHNSFIKARGQLINDAYKSVIDIYRKYKDIQDDIVDIVIDTYQGDKQKARQTAEELLSDEDSAKLLKALDIFKFSNGANEQIFQFLSNVLRKERAINDKETLNYDAETGENSSASENSELDAKKDKQGITSQTIDDNKRNSQNETTQPLQPVEMPLQPIIDKPTRTLKIITNNSGQLVTIKNSTTKAGKNIKAIQNEDGSFELDVASLPRNEQLALIHSGMFTYEDINYLDKESTWHIDKNPIVRQTGKSYEIVEQGTISEDVDLNTILSNLTQDDRDMVDILLEDNTITLDQLIDTFKINKLRANKIYKAAKLLANQQNNTATTTPIEGNNNAEEPVVEQEEPIVEQDEKNEDEEKQPTSSTGEEEQRKDKEVKQNLNIDSLNKSVLNIFNAYIQDITSKDIDFDTVEKQVRKQAIEQGTKVGYNEDEINKVIDQQLQVLKEANAKVQEIKDKLDKTGANLSYAARYEEVDNVEFSSFFISAINNFMKEYKKVVPVPEINDKQVVKLEDILRVCNSAYGTFDTNMAKTMYDVIRKYLLSPTGRALYIVTDIDNDKETTIDNLNKTPDEIQDKYDQISGIATERVNIAQFIETLDSRGDDIKQKYYKAFNNLKIGDKLILRKSEEGDKPQLIVEKDGIVIGNLPVPGIIEDTYIVNNSGWITDIKLDGNNQVISNSRDVILDLFLGTTANHDNLRALLTQYSIVDKYNKNDKTLSDFENNPLIKQLIHESIQAYKNNKQGNILFVNKTNNGQYSVDTDNVLDYLAKLWQYSMISVGTNKEKNKQIIINSVNRWFKNRYNTYDNVYNYYHNGTNIEVEVANINSGKVIKIIDDKSQESIIDNYNKLLLPSEAIADFDNTKLSIVTRAKGSVKLVTSGHNEKIVNGFVPGSTLVSVFSKNKTEEYINAIGLKINPNTLKQKDTEIGQILNAAIEELGKALNALETDLSDAAINKLEEILSYIIDCKQDKNIIPLFRPIRGRIQIDRNVDIHKVRHGIRIAYLVDNAPKRRITIFNKGLSGQPTLGWNDTKWQKNTDFTSDNSTIVHNLKNAISELLVEYCNVNISTAGILSDNIANPYLRGFVKRNDKGQCVININDNYNKTFDSYSDFIVKGDLIKVNTKKGDNGTNFERISDDMLFNQNLYISLPLINTKKETKPIETKQPSDHVEKNSDKTTFADIKTTISTNKENVGIELFKKLLGNDEYDKFVQVSTEFNILNDILPTRIFYDSYMNDYDKNDNHKGVIAYSNGDGLHTTYKRYVNGKRVTATMPSNESVIVGPLLLNMLSSYDVNRRKRGIRKLIHEQLHIKIGEDLVKKKELLDNIIPVYNEFKKHLDKDLSTLDKNSRKYKELENIRNNFKDYRGDRLIEEFLVESMTNEVLFKYLNDITTNTSDNNKEDTLFTRIIKAIAKLFGWTINNNSLFMKELNILRDLKLNNDNNIDEVIETDTETEVETNNNDEIINEEQSNSDIMNDINDEDEDIDDDLGFTSNLEEITEDKDGFKTFGNLDSFRNNLNSELRTKFDDFYNKGLIQIKCK